MTKLMIDISFTDRMVTQDGQAIPFHSRGHLVLDARFTNTAIKEEDDDINSHFQSEPETIVNHFDDSSTQKSCSFGKCLIDCWRELIL